MIDKQRYKDDLLKWLQNEDWSDSLSYTLIFPSGTKESRHAVVGHAEHYFNLLDYRVYKNGVHRDQRRCQRINFIENGANGDNIHIHGIIKVPDDKKVARPTLKTIPMFQLMMETYWANKMSFNKDRTDKLKCMVRPADADGNCPEQWLGYSSKFINPFNPDGLCVATSWLPK